jgi:FemAB-related protein (PEP-CTERM system-associated)
MRVFLCSNPEDGKRWEQFVDSNPLSSNYHRWKWKRVIESSFGWPTFYCVAEEDGRVLGILPVVWQKSRLFGSFMTSLPFLNAGGILADSEEAEKLLLKEALRLTKDAGANYLELRHRQAHQLGLTTKTNKITLVLPVSSDQEKMWKDLGTKMRTKVRKSLSHGMTSEVGGIELLDDFYRVFSQNMRDLGTPVYGRNFFTEILQAFPQDTFVCVIRHKKNAVAVSFLSGYRDRIEAIWSSSSQEYLSLKPNICLYWNLLCFAGQKGYRLFDFGRSSVNSGTHEFKSQWGAQPHQLYWDYWLPEGGAFRELNPQNPRYRAAIWLWQKLPVPVTRLIGPSIVRCLP